MPNVTIYVPDDLAREIRAREIPISRTCQVALRRQVRLAQRRQPLNPAPPNLAASGGRGSVRVGKWRS